jgi:mitochondrial fission protein ELM1
MWLPPGQWRLEPRRGGTLLVIGSPRTDPEMLEAPISRCSHGMPVADDDGPSFAALLDDADEIFVTADSVSMLSEAIITGKPVGMVPVKPDRVGLRASAKRPGDCSISARPKRDPRRFWAYS